MELRNYTNKLLNYLLPWRHTMTTATTAARTPNYTDAMVASMIADYTADPSLDTVATIARSMNKARRSVIAKLVREGVYKATPRVTKTGAPVIRKSSIVASICSEVGLTSLPSLDKASKADLETLLLAVQSKVA